MVLIQLSCTARTHIWKLLHLLRLHPITMLFCNVHLFAGVEEALTLRCNSMILAPLNLPGAAMVRRNELLLRL